MFNIEIIAVGRLKKNSAFCSLFNDYTKRLNGKFNLIELEGKSQAGENQKILEKIDPQAALIVMDERGKSNIILESLFMVVWHLRSKLTYMKPARLA